MEESSDNSRIESCGTVALGFDDDKLANLLEAADDTADHSEANALL